MAPSKSSSSDSLDGDTSAKPIELVNGQKRGLKDDKPMLTKKVNVATGLAKRGKLIYSNSKQASSQLNDGLLLVASPTTRDRKDSTVRNYTPTVVMSKKKVKNKSEAETESSKSQSGQQVLLGSELQCASETDDEQFGSEELVYCATRTGLRDKKFRRKEKRRKYRERKRNRKRLEKLNETTQVVYQETLFKRTTDRKTTPARDKSCQTAKTTADVQPKKTRLLKAVLISSSLVKLPPVMKSKSSLLPRRFDCDTFIEVFSPEKLASPGDSFRTTSSSVEPVDDQEQMLLANTAMPPSSPTTKVYRRLPANAASSMLPSLTHQPLSSESSSDLLFEAVSPIAKQPTDSLCLVLGSPKRQPKQPYPTLSDLNSVFTENLPNKSSSKHDGLQSTAIDSHNIFQDSPEGQPGRQSLKSLETNPIGFDGGSSEQYLDEQDQELQPEEAIPGTDSLSQTSMPGPSSPSGVPVGSPSSERPSTQNRKASKGASRPRLIVRFDDPNKHQNQLLERIKRSDSLAQVVENTSGCNAGASPTTQEQPLVSPPRWNAKFNMALIAVCLVCLLIAGNFVSRSYF